jgi:hypothetical protein
VEKFIRIGVDLAKNYFQIHALTSEGGTAVTARIPVNALLGWFCVDGEA